MSARRTLSVVGVLLSLALLAAAPGSLSAQPATTVATSEAREFLGRWSFALVAGQGQGEMTIGIDIRDEDGRIGAEVTTDIAPESAEVGRISRAGDALVLTFLTNVQGQPIPVQFTLTPAGENLAVEIDAADGMFMAEATARPAQ